MGDMADDYEIQQMAAQDRAAPALKKLESWCAGHFPYVCTGKKTVSSDGRTITCECGNGIKNMREY